MLFERWREELFRSKQIAPLALGMKQEEVIATFGEPDDESSFRKKGKPLILKYGDVEFHFDQHRDHRLFLVYSEFPDGNPRLSVLDERAATDRKRGDAG